MSWQEDLRRLDADLAAGRIEPGLHRKQRDELLAQASGSTVPSPVPSPLRRPGAPTWHSTNPAYGQQPPPPPPQRVQAPQPRSETPPEQLARPAPDQLAQPMPARPPRQPTRHVPPPQASEKTLSPDSPEFPNHLTTAPSPADINPTRYLRVDGPAAHRSPASRFPPLTPPGGKPVVQHTQPLGPEPGKHRWDDTPEPPRAKGKKPTWLFLSLGVLVVLAMIAGATLWLGKADDPVAPQAGSLSPTPRVPAGAIGSLEERLPPLPGRANPGNSTMSVAKAKELGLVTPKVADLLSANGVTEVTYRGSNDRGTSILVLIASTSGPANAQNVVNTQYQDALANGFKNVQASIRTVSGVDRETFLNTSWYGSGNYAVFVGIGQPFVGQAGLSNDLDQAVKLVEQVLPAG